MFANLLGKSESDNLNVACETAKIYIGERIQATHAEAVQFLRNIDEENAGIDDENEETETPFDSQEMCTSETRIGAWINEINDEAKELVSSSDNGDRDNILENKEFAKLFARLCKMLPLFSAISNKVFNSPNLVGSSWSSETYFKNVKQLHGDGIPCSADVFIKRDIELTNGSVVKASQNIYSIQTERVHFHKSVSQTDAPDNDDSDMPIESIDDLAENFPPSNTSKATHKASSTDHGRIKCPACRNGDLPAGAHKCMVCEKSVHPFDECSLSIGDEEGYGERRKCVACHQIGEIKSCEKQLLNAKEMNHNERWNRPSRSKSSKYTKPVPNWNLIEMNKRVRIGCLANENLIQTVYNIGGAKVKLSNTCGIDSPTQLTATAIAYHQLYRSSIANENDGIFKIAKALASKYAFQYHFQYIYSN